MNLKNLWEKSLKERNWPKRLEQLAEDLSNLAQNLANQGQFVRQPIPIPVRSGKGNGVASGLRNLHDSYLSFSLAEVSNSNKGVYLNPHWFLQHRSSLVSDGPHVKSVPLFLGHFLGLAGLLQLSMLSKFCLINAAKEMFTTKAISKVAITTKSSPSCGLATGASVLFASGCLFSHMLVNLRKSRTKCFSNMFSNARSYHSYHRYNFNQHLYQYYNHFEWRYHRKSGLNFFKYKNFFARRFHSNRFWWKYKPAFISIRDQIFNTSKFKYGGYMFLYFSQGKPPLGLGGGYKGANYATRTSTQLRSLLFGSDYCDQPTMGPKEKFSKPSRFVKVDSTGKSNPILSLKFPKSVMSVSLSPSYHQITLQMARTDSSATVEEKIEADQLINGSYIEFSIFASLGSSFNHETVLSEETIDELLDDLDILIQRIQTLKQDLEKIFELGALPIKFIKSRWVLRVYFPNCEPEKLQKLCQEKNVMGGTIFEDLEHLGDAVVAQSRKDSVCSTPNPPVETARERDTMEAAVANVSEPSHALTAGSIGMFNQLDHVSFPSDVLSTFDNSSTISTDITNDIISLDPLSNEEIVRLDDGTNPFNGLPMETIPVSIVDSFSDEYHWVSSN